MSNSIQIVLPLSTWELLEESLLQALPHVSQTSIEIVVTPTPSCQHTVRNNEHLYSKLKGIQARLSSNYPHLTFNYNHIIEKNRADDLGAIFVCSR